MRRPIPWDKMDRLEARSLNGHAIFSLIANKQGSNRRLVTRLNALLGYPGFVVGGGAIDCTLADVFLAIHHYAPQLFDAGKADGGPSVPESKFAGMTTNERLYTAGLLDLFDQAARRRDRALMIEVLGKVELADQAVEIVDAILAHRRDTDFDRPIPTSARHPLRSVGASASGRRAWRRCGGLLSRHERSFAPRPKADIPERQLSGKDPPAKSDP